MQLQPEDPRLTAYVLGELGPEDTAAVELAVAADPALQAKVAEMKDIQRILTNRLVQPTDKLLPRQRERFEHDVAPSPVADAAHPCDEQKTHGVRRCLCFALRLRAAPLSPSQLWLSCIRENGRPRLACFHVSNT